MNAKNDLDTCLLFILEKLESEYEIAKRQRPQVSRVYNTYNPQCEAKVPEARWREWSRELNIDYTHFESILKILKNEGLLLKFEFIAEYE
ncbi:MAG: hypothetical protein V4519_03195 [Patescibacteria group bacterium]